MTATDGDVDRYPVGEGTTSTIRRFDNRRTKELGAKTAAKLDEASAAHL